MLDSKADIASQVMDAYQKRHPFCIQTGGTKYFYGRKIQGERLSLQNLNGIIEYEPSELFITAYSGTLIHEIEQTIDQQNQMLPFEPPHFGPQATLGGMIATGLSGPRRISCGAIRDSILGVEIINGKGEVLQFGGKVMKNVAGYDVSRLMCGALGTLGILISITLRLIPKPACERTVVIPLNIKDVIEKMTSIANSTMPISATFYDGDYLYIRLAGSLSTIKTCSSKIGGEQIDEHQRFWENIKEHKHEFFKTDLPLWRISVPPYTAPLEVPGSYVMEWNGGLRWYATDTSAEEIRSKVTNTAGHACLFKGNTTKQIFHPLSNTELSIHRRLKQAFDPASILNPGKMYAEF